MSQSMLELQTENAAGPDGPSADFNWCDPDLAIIPEQPETAIYINPRGQLVIRQRGNVFEDDPFVYFDRDRIPRLIQLIKEALDDA